MIKGTLFFIGFGLSLGAGLAGLEQLEPRPAEGRAAAAVSLPMPPRPQPAPGRHPPPASTVVRLSTVYELEPPGGTVMPPPDPTLELPPPPPAIPVLPVESRRLPSPQ